MSRIAARFQRLATEGRGALIPFIEACDPDPATSLALLRGLPAAGADLIEIGAPFTDPVADGPIIQKAAQRALAAGATLERLLDMVRTFRTDDFDTPVIVMGYFNPIHRYGPARFCQDAAAAGVDGLIVVDLPPEEADSLLPHATAHHLDMIRLIAPTTDDARLREIVKDAAGFLYYVSITGITGTHAASTEDLSTALPRIRRATDCPVVIGFGIRTPAQAAAAARIADGAVVASALIETICVHLDETGRALPDLTEAVFAQVRDLSQAVRN